MKQLLLVIFFCFPSLLIYAQHSDATSAILRAYAKGENSVATAGNSETYDPAKKYIVFAFWNEKDPLTENERADMDYLQIFLTKKNVEVVELQWSNISDLKEAVKKYNLEVYDSKEDHFIVKGENFHMNSNAKKAWIVIEDGKPVTICCGKFCGLNLKQYFKLQTVN
jgi:hypothetical protein